MDLNSGESFAAGGRAWLLVGDGEQLDLKRIGDDIELEVTPRDRGWHQAKDRSGAIVGWLEQVTPRVVAWYGAGKSGTWVARAASLPKLDRAWFSGSALTALWDWVAQNAGLDTVTRVICRHQDMVGGDVKLVISDTVAVLRGRLARLQQAYPALAVIGELRVPDGAGGGVDLGTDGRIARLGMDRAGFCRWVGMLARWYDQMLDMQERRTGQPVTIRYRNKLTDRAFRRVLAAQFGQRPGEFRLWGQPLLVGNNCVHVYGRDRHRWGPVTVDLHADGLTMVAPWEMSSNVICRVVAAVQSGIDPTAGVYVGESSYVAMWRDALRGVADGFTRGTAG